MKFLLVLLPFCCCNFIASDSPKIVGGKPSSVSYPYQLSLQLNTTYGGLAHICGASVVAESFFVTAAHCVKDMNITKLSVLVGTSNLKNTTSATRLLIDSCLIHPDYVKLNNSDIALCHTQTPFVFSDSIAAIDLSTEVVGGGVNCTLAGWGSTRRIRELAWIFPGVMPTQLQQASLTTLTTDACRKKGQRIGEKEICTFDSIFVGACAGVSIKFNARIRC